MLHIESVEAKTLGLLKRLQSLHIFQQCRLVGGTALALQIGHRKSVDLDLFGTIEATPDEIQNICQELGDFEISKATKNINTLWIDGIKVDCVNYPYKWIENCVVNDGIRMASINDIAAMKILAIINRGTKKDFIDLYFLLKRMSLNDILDLYEEKYANGSRFLAIKSLTYFEDAESDPMPFMFYNITWDRIKKSIITEVRNL